MSTIHIKDYLLQAKMWLRNNYHIVVLSTLILTPMTTIGTVYAAEKIPPSLPADVPVNIDDSLPLASLPEYVVIQPSDQVTFSSETSASVATITVKEGSTFKKGDVLLLLDCRLQDADLKKAKSQQEVNNLGYTSAKKLNGYGAISDLELLQAKSQRDMANAEVDKLSAIVEKCKLTAPFNGSVAKLMVHIHETVKPGDPLLKIVSTDNLDFVLQVPSTWLEWIHIDSPFTVQVNELNEPVSAKITKISPEIDSVSQTVKIIGKQTDTQPGLLPGMSGQANFPDKPIKQR